MEYEALFSKRAESYLAALSYCPTAMDEEFAAAINACDLHDGETLVSIPGGCENLRNALAATGRHVHYLPFETSPEIASLTKTPTARLNAIPLPSSSVDKVLSLASLHHATDEERAAFYIECRRILRPGGQLIIGDVEKGSKQDAWLNTFVNDHSTPGHAGKFWDKDADKSLFEAQGFHTITRKYTYAWTFPLTPVMLNYCKQLFYLDKASLPQIQEGLSTFLNASETQFEWSLLFFISTVRP
jgi:SAM-dependent methyltransferase